MTRTGFLGVGSNVGDRLAMLRAARDELDSAEAIVVTGSSSAYETEPQGEVLDQPDFLNACVSIETSLGPEELLDACKRVEQELGRRTGGPRHGPRAIDVDLLLLGDVVCATPRLTLPHRDIANRRFVVEPLLELDPHLALPSGERVSDLLDGLSGQRVERTGAL